MGRRKRARLAQRYLRGGGSDHAREDRDRCRDGDQRCGVGGAVAMYVVVNYFILVRPQGGKGDGGHRGARPPGERRRMFFFLFFWGGGVGAARGGQGQQSIVSLGNKNARRRLSFWGGGAALLAGCARVFSSRRHLNKTQFSRNSMFLLADGTKSNKRASSVTRRYKRRGRSLLSPAPHRGLARAASPKTWQVSAPLPPGC